MNQNLKKKKKRTEIKRIVRMCFCTLSQNYVVDYDDILFARRSSLSSIASHNYRTQSRYILVDLYS